MKNLLLVFVVLLFLLTLLSSFGGAIRTEPFYDSVPAITSIPQPPVEKRATSGPATVTTPTSPPIFNESPPVSASVVPITPSLENVPQAPSMTNMTVPPSTNNAVKVAQTEEPFTNYEKVDVPAPFYDKDFGAPI